MDQAGVDMQILSVTIPGVQMFEPGAASALAIATNDHLAAAIARHPVRFAGLACFAPQDPGRATKEMERAVSKLGLNGFIVNSHTGNLSRRAAVRADPGGGAGARPTDRPIYLHPRAPSNGVAAPFRDYIWYPLKDRVTHGRLK